MFQLQKTSVRTAQHPAAVAVTKTVSKINSIHEELDQMRKLRTEQSNQLRELKLKLRQEEEQREKQRTSLIDLQVR